MKHRLHSHCGGDKEVPAALQKEIGAAIDSIPGLATTTPIRNSFLRSLKISGWSSEVCVSQGSDMTITSLKDDVGLCMQTGNMARMYADLIKLQTMYLNGAIRAAIIVIPAAPLAKRLGSNIAQAERLERELEIFKKAFHVPTLVFAFQ